MLVCLTFPAPSLGVRMSLANLLSNQNIESMNSEHHIVAFFTAKFAELAKGKELAGGKAAPRGAPVRSEIETTFNIACEVLGSDKAGELADKAGL